MVLKSCDLHNRPVTAVSQLKPVVSIREISLSGLSNKLNRLLIHSGTALPSLLRTVAEQQSFTRAAEKLRVAQSAISQQIKTLEEELEVTLLSRTKRSVKLTAAGHAFLREANDILYRVEKSRVEARRAERRRPAHYPLVALARRQHLSFAGTELRVYRIRYPGVRIDCAN